MDPITCYNCEEEFKVETIFETEATVCFCPFCGTDLEFEEEDDDADFDELDTDENSWN